MAASIAVAADAAIFREQGKSQEQLVGELRQMIREAGVTNLRQRKLNVLAPLLVNAATR